MTFYHKIVGSSPTLSLTPILGFIIVGGNQVGLSK